MTVPVTLPAAYFDAMYQATADPWGFEDRWYEQRKYAISLAQLPAARYRSAFEPGCSVGVLTRLLASRCDTLLSCDVAAAAVRAAADRTQDLAHVLVEQRDLPRQWPAGRFDLVVFSEILYYFGDHDPSGGSDELRGSRPRDRPRSPAPARPGRYPARGAGRSGDADLRGGDS